MAGQNKPKIYLDTCFVLDWLTGNQGRGDAHDVGGIISELCSDRFIGVTSVITKLEVLECKNDPTMWAVWQRLQARSNFQVLPVLDRIGDCAYKIRNFYQAQKDAGAITKKAPQVPDTIHIATAIHAGCDYMVTSDAGRMDSKHLSPLELNGMVANLWPLRIERPRAVQTALNI
ncbi:type II toxin-antitoxin system VapC family toxin [Microvirga lotononidis]|uniref:type II toxin-antitoxin system VapC family toxin n=1 Tax=Microvirga lotononidis TaxID=864069 RepID=UPI0009FFB5E7